MKTGRLILVAVILLVACASQTMAATVGYLDVIAGGVVEKEANPTAMGSTRLANGEDDLKLSIISAGGLLLEKIKLGAEYGQGTVESSPQNEDLSLWSVKTGYRLVDCLAVKLDLIGAWLDIDTDSSELQTALWGLDGTVYFSKKMFLTASLVYGNGTYEKKSLNRDGEVPVALARLKFHYFLNDKIGLTAGYSRLQYSCDAIVPGADLGDMDIRMGGPTLGMIYKF